MLRLVLVAAALGLVAGCATGPSPAPATVAQGANGSKVAGSDAGGGKQVCVREKPIGSDIPVTRCHDEPSDVAKGIEMDALRQQVNQATRPSVSSGSGAGY